MRRAITGGGGHHYWFRFPPGTTCRSIAKSEINPKADSITLKAEGGYVIIPPSKIDCPEHEGRAYRWELKPWEMTIAEGPAWLLVVKPPKAKATSPEVSDPWIVQDACLDLLTHPGGVKGQRPGRPDILCQLVGVHLARGDSHASIMQMAEAWAKRCQPPLEEHEWRKHVDGLIEKEERKAELVCSLPTAEANGTPGLVCSLPVAAAGEQQPAGVVSVEKPILQASAYHGLLGQMLKAIEPETEADPAGILLGFLTCFGNIVGRGSWVQVGPRSHHPALYVGVVGRTSDAKGDGWAASLWPFKQIEPGWASVCIANGVGSGEGLLERIADDQQVINKKGEVEIIPGAADKRCLLRLSELSRCFKLGRRENATLSEHLREAWDGEPIHLPNRRGNALSSQGYAISVLGDVTPRVLGKLLETGTEAIDGWANRFLWCCVQSPRCVPSCGNMTVLDPFLVPLAETLAFAKKAGELKRDDAAEALWHEVYPALKTSGDDVPHTERARPYVVRLHLLYALADRSSIIRQEHLQAALAVWDYCRASARLLFADQPDQPEAPADPLSVRLLNAIILKPGIDRTGLRGVAGHKVPVGEIETALTELKAQGLAHSRKVQPPGGGHPAECWWPGPGPGPEPEPRPEGDSLANDTIPAAAGNQSAAPSASASASASALALAVANEGREGTNCRGQDADGKMPGREGTNSGLAASAELVPSPAVEGANSRQASAELVPSPQFAPRQKAPQELVPSPQFAPQEGQGLMPSPSAELVPSLHREGEAALPSASAWAEGPASSEAASASAGAAAKAAGGVIQNASADMLLLLAELDWKPSKPIQTPWAGLNALLTPDTLAFILYDSDRKPHYRFSFEADAEAMANLRRQHPDLQERLKPFWTEADADDYRRRFPHLKRLPHADTWHVELAVEACAKTLA